MNAIETAYRAKLRERSRVDAALKATRLGGLFLSYERAMGMAGAADMRLSEIEEPTRKERAAALQLWDAAGRARAALAYALIGELVPDGE